MSAPFQISRQLCVDVLMYHSLGGCVPNTCFVMMPASSKQLLFSLHLQQLKSTDRFVIIHTSLLSGMAGSGGVKRNHGAQIHLYSRL